MASPEPTGEELAQTLILRLQRSDREQWQGQLIDSRTQKTYRFTSYVECQRLMLKLRNEMPSNGG